MRYLNSKGIFFEKIEYKEPKNIDFNNLEADITILAYQHGIGKTHWQ